MKKALVTLAALMTAFFMISCQNETTSGNNEDTTAEKIDLYNRVLLGTSWEEKWNDEDFADYKTLSFKESSILINGVEYSIDLTKDLYYDSEITEVTNKLKNCRVNFYIFVNNEYLGFNSWTFKTEKVDYLSVILMTDTNSTYKLVSSSSGSSTSDGSSTETVTLSGNYTISQANGSTISFSNGNWTYSYLSSTKSGTYSQSGNELTMNYSAGGSSVSGVFTVAKDGSNVKLTGESGNYTTIVSSAFMVKDSDAITNGVVTLTAK